MKREIVVMFSLLAALPCAVAAKPRTPPSASAETLTHLSCKGEPREIRIVIRNVKRAEGLVTADLYANNEQGFLHKEGRIARARFAARAPVTVLCINAPTTDDFAVAVYQDKNANTKLDKGAFGIPAEPYGVSNNPKMRFAAPKVGEALFHVPDAGATVEIELRN